MLAEALLLSGPVPVSSLVSIMEETPSDMPAREALLDAAMGPMRRRKSSEAIRRDRLPAQGLAFVAKDENGTLVGTVRLWSVAAGDDDRPALLLGPLAVAKGSEGLGLGTRLMRRAIAEAAWRGHRAVLLVGDPDYYERFGFSAAKASGLAMPGPFERHRMLGLELADNTLKGASGMIRPTGRLIDAVEENAALVA
ncbi:GNAT family N-acetyltransferase [Aureimonas psammosilenae]|uniref:GNAT family N-acetyltransferase n=1 Tax=Aureimonas psammosilenae TaxID=2495496 RepID=UPI0012608A19|nr:N-acetyltransferase [Aureimonas psammosilenae]